MTWQEGGNDVRNVQGAIMHILGYPRPRALNFDRAPCCILVKVPLR